MKYFKIDDSNNVVAIADAMPAELNTPSGYALWSRQLDGTRHAGWLNRNDIGTFEYAQMIAAAASAFTGKNYIATDAGDHVAPRYDVIEAPALGDEVSMAFNGDYYPAGRIVKIGKNMQNVTVDGPRGQQVFRRRKLSGAWLYRGFSMIPGTISRLNPEF